MREMGKATGHICEVLRDANDRYFAINNRASREDRERQARDLLTMMKVGHLDASHHDESRSLAHFSM